jgi:hypothetical protein
MTSNAAPPDQARSARLGVAFGRYGTPGRAGAVDPVRELVYATATRLVTSPSGPDIC